MQNQIMSIGLWLIYICLKDVICKSRD